MRVTAFALLGIFAFGCADRPEAERQLPATTAAASPSPSAVPVASDETTARTQPSTAGSNVTLDRPETIRTNPFRISGTARTFENNVSLRILGEKGNLIEQTHATATGELGHFNPWEREILLSAHPGAQVTIEAFEVSAKDGSIQSLVTRNVPFDVPARAVTLYLHDPQLAPNDCTRVFARTHRLPATTSIARALAEALIRAPGSPFPAGSGVQRIAIQNGVLAIDFNERLQNVGGSCRAQAIRASIERTLAELPGVDRVEITSGGSSDLALQP